MTIVIPQNPQDLAVSTMRIAKCLLAADTTGDTKIYDVIIGSGDSAAVVNLFQFQHHTLIYDVGWRVRAPFTASMTLTIGDSDAAAGWAAAANVGATVADTAIFWGRQTVYANLTGGADTTSAFPTAAADSATPYGYAGRLMVADTIGSPLNLTATVAGAVPATGQIEIYAMYCLMGGQRDMMAT